MRPSGSFHPHVPAAARAARPCPYPSTRTPMQPPTSAPAPADASRSSRMPGDPSPSTHRPSHSATATRRSRPGHNTARRATRTRPLARGIALLFATAALGAATPAHAQYFGRNKVQYETFDFQVLRTPHFDVHYYPAGSQAAADAARMAERWYARLAGVFGHELRSRKPIILYSNHTDFQQTNTISGPIDEGTGGVTESLLNRVILPLTHDYAGTDHVLGHELVHAFQYDIANVARGSSGSGIGLAALPQWFIDGMAEYLSLGRHDPHTAMWMRDAVLRDDIPTIERLSRDPRYFPYRFGHAVLAWVGGEWGDTIFGPLFRTAVDKGLEQAFLEVLGFPSDSLSAQWADALRYAYAPVIAERVHPASVGRRVLARGMGAGYMILAPAASPDGRTIAFLSERDFSIELYLADAETGRVIRKLASASTGSHLDAISYMGSAGAWAPDGRRFAYVALTGGKAEIRVVDVESGDLLRRLGSPDVDAIATPAWSPDGRHIAFSGSDRGITDLYIVEVESGALRRLTRDRFGDLQPTWSPDGRTIAFVTDRGADTDFQQLSYSRSGIAWIDVESGEIRSDPIFDAGKHHSPQFSPDGRDLYFVADRGGVSDVYRLDLETGETFRVTRVATGVSGLTDLSPALTVAAEAGTLFFSVFHERVYEIHALEPDQAHGQRVERGSGDVASAALAAGSPHAAPTAGGGGPGHASAGTNPAVARAGWLPPAEHPGRVDRYLADPGAGLMDAEEFEPRDYRRRPHLAYLGPPSFGLGISQYGVAIYGSMAAFFTDILGNHDIGVLGEAYGGVKDLGGQLVYLNRERRLNWGAGIGRIPYRSDFLAIRDSIVDVNGVPRLGRVIDELRNRLFFDQFVASARYPLSTTRRFEFSAGVMRVGYDFEIERRVVSGGRTVDRQRIDLPAPDPLTLVQPTLAYVGDYSTHGLTSPLAGGRFRFEIQPTAGSLRYVGVLADYRRYLYTRPFTFAVRGMHYGRYGPDDDRVELGPLFLGNPGLVRGYGPDSFRLGECTPTTSIPAGCAEFDRLIGSRVAVANLEARLYLLGPDRLGLIPAAFLPTEVTAFVDAGVAWSAGDGASLTFARTSTERIPVFSAGGMARVNLLGFAVVGVYYAVPFQRPAAGPQIGFLLAPGW